MQGEDRPQDGMHRHPESSSAGGRSCRTGLRTPRAPGGECCGALPRLRASADPEHTIAQRILRGWYLGLVGGDHAAERVACGPRGRSTVLQCGARGRA